MVSKLFNFLALSSVLEKRKRENMRFLKPSVRCYHSFANRNRTSRKLSLAQHLNE